MNEVPKKSWRTTTMGILALLGALIPAAKAIVDGDPNTSIDVNEIGVAVMGFFTAIGLFAARDNKVTSEQAGAKKDLPEAGKWPGEK